MISSITIFFTISVLLISSQAVYAGGGQAPEFALKCYLLGQGTPPIQPGPTPFTDQFQATLVDPDGDQRYCVEALKHSSTPPPNPRYWVEHEDEAVALNDAILNPNGVIITDQFLGTYTANLFHFETLVPSAVTGLVAGPVNTQPYSGYSPSVLQSTNPLPTTSVMVSDQFATSMITLDSIFAFEASAIVGPQGTLTAQDMTCYMYLSEDEIQISGNIDPTPAQSASLWITQFAPNGVAVADLDQADVLCVMSVKTEPTTPPVGGELLPIDSTTLLLAGLQTSAIWMLPVLAGGSRCRLCSIQA